MHTMTPRQRELATKTHNIIYAYLRDRKLTVADYYDVVVFGFMEAVQQYDENEELAKKYKLSTIAYRKMDDKLSALRIYENRKKRKADVRSLEATLAGMENMWHRGHRTKRRGRPRAEGGGQRDLPSNRGTRNAEAASGDGGQGRRIYHPGGGETLGNDTRRHLQPDSKIQRTRRGRHGLVNQEEQNAVLQHLPELRLQLRPRRKLRLPGREGGDEQ